LGKANKAFFNINIEKYKRKWIIINKIRIKLKYLKIDLLELNLDKQTH